jgi:hypothetical protein
MTLSSGVQEVMQWCVLPFEALLVGQCLQLAQVKLCDFSGPLLVGRIAKIYAAAKRPGLAGGAEVVLLKRAKIGGSRSLKLRCVFKQNLGFQVAQEQHMAIFLKPATSAAGDANRTGLGHGSISLAVNLQHPPADLAVHARLNPNNVDAAGNFFDADKLALPRPGTALASGFPGFLGFDVAVPKWPGPALPRTHGVNRAAGLAVPEDAITIVSLAQAPAFATSPSMQALGFLKCLTAKLCDAGQFSACNPHKPGRTSAAIAATRATKCQAIGIPGFGHKELSLLFKGLPTDSSYGQQRGRVPIPESPGRQYLELLSLAP